MLDTLQYAHSPFSKEVPAQNVYSAGAEKPDARENRTGGEGSRVTAASKECFMGLREMVKAHLACLFGKRDDQWALGSGKFKDGLSGRRAGLQTAVYAKQLAWPSLPAGKQSWLVLPAER